MSGTIDGMFQTFQQAQVRYRSTGDTRHKPAADSARNAIEQYIVDLQRTVQSRETEFQNYTRDRVGTGNEVDQIANEARQVRENTDKIAGQYLVAESQNQPIPINWSQYYVKFAILGGLVIAGVAGAFVR